MWPLWFSPSRLPAPRISRSRIAILNPEPSSVASPIVFSRSYASSLSDAVGGMEEVGVGPLPGTADAAAQLVELAEAEQVGAVDDERVDRRHVDARLDDRRADEHVVLALPEVDDDLLERALVHLAVGDRDPGLGHEVADLGRDLLDVLHPVVHEEHLALAEQLAADRLADGPVVVLADVGEDRLAIGGRRVQQRQVADAGEAHLERARDRRRGERQHVDVGLQLLDRLLVADAEALLLVDHEQAESLELRCRRTAGDGCR